VGSSRLFSIQETSIHASLLPVLAIVFVATVIRSAFGFGEALIAVPLLVLFMPLPVAAPLAVLLSITVAAVVVAQDWRHIHLRSAAGLVVATIFGIPLGLLVLTNAHQQVVKAGLGILTVLFAAYSLASGARRAPAGAGAPAVASAVWISGRNSGWSVWNERAATGGLRLVAEMVAAAISRDAASLFSACKRVGNDWLLERRALDTHGDARVPAFGAGDASGGFARAGYQPSLFRRRVSSIRVLWAGLDRRAVVGGGADASCVRSSFCSLRSNFLSGHDPQTAC
jgi:hypothetical protein